MPNCISSNINTHHYPRLYFRFPFLLRLHHLVVAATTLRVWSIHRSLRKLLRILPSKFNFYDAGCGAGDMIIPFLSRYPESSFLGIDKLADNVAVCNAYSHKRNFHHVSFQEASVEDFLPVMPVDLVVCITVLQYVKHDVRALRNFYSILKPGGYLVLYVPVNYDRIFPWYKRFVDKFFHDVDYDLEQGIQRLYTQEDIYHKLKNAGFIVSSNIFAYGKMGKIAFELYSTGLSIIKKLPWVLSILIAIPFIFMVYPFILVFMVIDFLQKHEKGNGLLVIARKST